MRDIDYFDMLPAPIREWLQDSDITGGMGNAQEVYLLYATFGLGDTIALLEAREAMEKARRPVVVGPGATLARRQGGSGPHPAHTIGGGMKKSTP